MHAEDPQVASHCIECGNPHCEASLGAVRCPGPSAVHGGPGTPSVRVVTPKGETQRRLSAAVSLAEAMAPGTFRDSLLQHAADLAAEAAHQESVPELWVIADPDTQIDIVDMLGLDWVTVGTLDFPDALDAVTEAWEVATESQKVGVLSALGVGL